MEIDQEIFYTVILLLPLIQEGLVIGTSESANVHEVLVITAAKSSFPRKKCGKVNSRGLNDHLDRQISR